MSKQNDNGERFGGRLNAWLKLNWLLLVLVAGGAAWVTRTQAQYTYVAQDIKQHAELIQRLADAVTDATMARSEESKEHAEFMAAMTQWQKDHNRLHRARR
jgi:ABC-type nitrate/sulfonate/bicarbonate transport system substrate-binding protein